MAASAEARWAIIRRLYEDDFLTVDEIAALAGCASSTIRLHAVKAAWTRRGPGGIRPFGKPPRPALRALDLGIGGGDDGAPVDRRALIGRLWASLDAYMRDEADGLHDADPRRAQRLDVLVRTIERLSGMERGAAEDRGAAEGEPDEETLRAELARRIEGLAREG